MPVGDPGRPTDKEGRGKQVAPGWNSVRQEPLAKLQWCDEFSTGMSGKRGVRGVLG